jgi:hypothetical protein
MNAKTTKQAAAKTTTKTVAAKHEGAAQVKLITIGRGEPNFLKDSLRSKAYASVAKAKNGMPREKVLKLLGEAPQQQMAYMVRRRLFAAKQVSAK